MAKVGHETESNDAGSGAPDVFVSYASQDAAVANTVVAAIENQGLRCWIAPRDVRPGEFYAGEIVHAIDATRVMVLVLSANSAASPHVLREVERAASNRHPFVTLRIDRTVLPAEYQYFLNTSHWLDASAGDHDGLMAKLVAAVRRQIEKSAPSTSSVTSARGIDSLSGGKPLRRRRAVVAGAFLTAVAVCFVGYVSWKSVRPFDPTRPYSKHVAPPTNALAAPQIPMKSVAVMPFTDMSEKKDQEYFSDGLAEELIDRLSRISDLRVSARTSSFYFKGKPMTIAQIAQDLGVANIVEGSVRRDRNIIRIAAQLIRADTGTQIWSVRYELPFKDLFKTQDDLANAIAGALKVTISEKLNYGGYDTKSPEAFDLYLQSVTQEQRSWSSGEIKQRLSKLERAVVLDPGYSDAWSVIAYLSARLALKAPGTPDKTLVARARDAARHAIETGPRNARAYFFAAQIRTEFDFDGKGAVEAYRRAVQFEPRGTIGLASAMSLHLMLGETSLAVESAREGVEVNPFGEVSRFNLALALYYNEQLTEAEVEIKRDLELDPEDEETIGTTCAILVAEGKAQDALDMAPKVPERLRLETLPLIYDVLGRKTDADTALKTLIELGDSEAMPIAAFYAHRNETDQAFFWLQRAYAFRDGSLWYIRSEPAYKSLRDDSRFIGLLKNLGLAS